MKNLVIILTIALTAACAVACGKSKTNIQENSAVNDSKTLVAYFSCTGNTEAVAKVIANKVNGTLYRIEPQEAYTTADLDWNDKESRSTVEMQDSTSRPAIRETLENVEAYDTIYIGYPIWWDLAPRAINTFIDVYGFKGKTVIPFATSGGSTIDNSARQLRKEYPNINWQPGRLLNHLTEDESAQYAI